MNHKTILTLALVLIAALGIGVLRATSQADTASQIARAPDAAGDLDPTFGADGRVQTMTSVTDDTLYEIVLQGDGSIIGVGHSDYSDNDDGG